MTYFTYFPKTKHDLTNVGQTVELTNILRRFKIHASAKERADVYYDYDIQAGDRPDTIAAKYYGNSNYAWIVLHFNDIVDPVFGWPLFNDDFREFIIGKYGSIPVAQATIHEYRQILNEATVYNEGVKLPKRTVVVDLTTYNTLAPEVRETVSKYEHEEELNEVKRRIRILDKRYLSEIRDEVKTILKSGV